MEHLLIELFKPQNLATTIAAIMGVIGTVVAAILPGISSQIKGWLIHLKERRLIIAQKTQVQQESTIQLGEEVSSHLLLDLRVTQIHILGMERPLHLDDIYVPQRVQEGCLMSYPTDVLLHEEVANCDPEQLMQEEIQTLEHHSENALAAEEAVAERQRCVIIGDPGMGKTTLLKYLALQSARKKLRDLPCIPIYVELHSYDPVKHPTLIDFIATQLVSAPEVETGRKWLQEELKKGRLLLLLDGLDETKTGRSDEQAIRAYIEMADHIKEIAATYPLVPIIVSARKASYQSRPRLQGFHELEVIGWRPEECRTLIRKWFTASYKDKDYARDKDEKIEDLLVRLERNPRILSLASNPLLLSLIIIVYKEHLYLPESRAELYERCIEVLLSRWDAEHSMFNHGEFKPEHKQRLLQEIAWHFYLQRRRSFPKQELLEVIRSFLPTIDFIEKQAEDVLKDIVIENGLLIERVHGFYSFSHLTFQEYFVARYVIEHNQLEELLLHVQDSWWQEVILLYAGMSPDVSNLLSVLIGDDERRVVHENMFYTNLLLAGSCLAVKPTIRNVRLREEVISRLFKLLCSVPYTLIQEQAAYTLAVIGATHTSGASHVNAHLLHILTSEKDISLTVRTSIAQALGAVREPGIVRDLIDSLTQRHSNHIRDRYIRVLVARILGNLRPSDISKSLYSILVDQENDWYVRLHVIRTLSVGGDNTILHSLVSQLLYTDVGPLNQDVATAIGMLSHQQDMPLIENLLHNEQIHPLLKINVIKALSISERGQYVSYLMRLLTTETYERYVREQAAYVLGSMELERPCIATLLQMLTHPEMSPEIGSSIVRSLGTCSIRGVSKEQEKQIIVQGLIASVSMKFINWRIRFTIIKLLSTFFYRKESTIEALQDVLREEPVMQTSVNVRMSIVGTLAYLGVRSKIGELLAFLIDDKQEIDNEVSIYLYHVLEHSVHQVGFDKTQVAEKFVSFLTQDGDRRVLQSIIKVLVALDVQDIKSELLALCENPAVDTLIRQLIVDSLDQFLKEEDFERIENLLNDPDIAQHAYRLLHVVNRRRECL